MKITSITRSLEPCVEAGWQADQYYLEQPITTDFIKALKPLGSLVFLSALSQPFFKVENQHYMIKGLLGDKSIRVACHRDYLCETKDIRKLIESI